MKITIKGKQFEVAPEPGDFWGWVQEGRYDHEWAILDRFVRPEHIFVDLGAWIGSHSLYASTITKNVVSVEPDPVAYDILECNLSAQGLDPAYRLAIAGYEGEITLGSGYLGASTTRANARAGGGIGAWEQGQQATVLCTTLREFASHIEGLLFIKMDVEGSEEDILKDFEFFEARKPTLYLELHPWWWKDQAAGWQTVRKIAGLYSVILDDRLNPLNINNTYPRALLLDTLR